MKKNGIASGLVRLFAAAAMFLFLVSCGAAQTEKVSFTMGSLMNIRFYTDEKAAAPLWNDILAGTSAMDAALSSTKTDSLINRLSEEGSLRPDADLYALIKKTADICDRCGGKLDITLGAVTRLWGFSGEHPRVPDKEELEKALALTGRDDLRFDDKSGTISVKSGTLLDFGAVGKGAACDSIYSVLKKQSAPAVASIGGTVLLYGAPPSENGWTVGIRDPHGTVDDWFALLRFKDTGSDSPVFISTSGTYEKQFEENGKRFHHLLDPATGLPVENGVAAVTAVSGEGLLSDALSTACFVSGLNQETLDRLDAFNAGAVFVFENGEVYVTEKLKDVFELSSDKFILLPDDYDIE